MTLPTGLPLKVNNVAIISTAATSAIGQSRGLGVTAQRCVDSVVIIFPLVTNRTDDDGAVINYFIKCHIA